MYRTAPVTLVTLVVLTGCSSSEARACTLIGAVSGVRVTGGTPHATVRPCLRADCGTTELAGDGVGFVALTTLPPGRSVLEVSTSVAGGQEVASRVDVTATTVRPNGPGCDPVASAAEVRLTGASRPARP